MPMKWFFLVLMIAVSSDLCAESGVLSLTKANWKGHLRLYQEGYSIIPSTEKSLQFIFQKTVVESGQSVLRAQQEMQKVGHNLKVVPAELYDGAKELGGTISERNGKANQNLENELKKISKAQSDLSKEQIKEAWGELVLGYREILPQEKSGWLDLKNYLAANLKLSKNELENLDRWLWSEGNAFDRAKNSWGESLSRAQREFENSYIKSGERNNSFMALGDIIVGYSKAIYYGIFRPSGAQVANGIKIGSKVLTHSLVGSAVVAKNIFLTSGRVFYYVAESGYYVIAPSAKASLYATLSLFNSTSSIFLKGTAPGLYVANQVAIKTVATTVSATYFSIGIAGETIKDTALFTYHLGKGVGEIALNQGQSAISLGYNLITALPAQMAMGVGTATLFLAWDGPRLVLYSFKHHDQLLLPKDVVIDKEKAKTKGTWTEVTDDSKIIDGLLEKMSKEEKN